MDERPNSSRRGSYENQASGWVDQRQHHSFGPDTYLFDQEYSPQQSRSVPTMFSPPPETSIYPLQAENRGFDHLFPNESDDSSVYRQRAQFVVNAFGYDGSGTLEAFGQGTNNNPPSIQQAMHSYRTTEPHRRGEETSPYPPVSQSSGLLPPNQDYWSPFNTRADSITFLQQRYYQAHGGASMIGYETGPTRSGNSSPQTRMTAGSSVEHNGPDLISGAIQPNPNPYFPPRAVGYATAMPNAPHTHPSRNGLSRSATDPPMLEQYLNPGFHSAHNNDGHLAPPRHQGSDVAPSSPSTTSAASSSTPRELQCPHDRCRSKFTGEYRKGNLARHMRLKHANGQRTYPCEAGCGKDFNRQDARLKHYRKRHPERAPGPAVPRGPAQG